MLTLVLAEAEVERMPAELSNHPAVIAHARFRGKPPRQILLDSNYHHAAMTNLSEGRRRGRPDITHLFLLTALESIVNKKGCLKILIHTRNDDLIMVNPKTRIMRNYERFLGLLEQLFENHAVPDKKQPLLTLTEGMSLPQIIEQQQADSVILLSKDGTVVHLPEYFKKIIQRKTNIFSASSEASPPGSSTQTYAPLQLRPSLCILRCSRRGPSQVRSLSTTGTCAGEASP